MRAYFLAFSFYIVIGTFQVFKCNEIVLINLTANLSLETSGVYAKARFYVSVASCVYIRFSA